jgi:hypothetical protein
MVWTLPVNVANNMGNVVDGVMTIWHVFHVVKVIEDAVGRLLDVRDTGRTEHRSYRPVTQYNLKSRVGISINPILSSLINV